MMASHEYVVVEFTQEEAVEIVHKSWIKITKTVSLSSAGQLSFGQVVFLFSLYISA